MAKEKVYKRKVTKEEVVATLKQPVFWIKVVAICLLAYLFFGFMLVPCLNTLTSIFTTRNSEGVIQPLAVIKFFAAGKMPTYVWNSVKLAVCLTITVNIVGLLLVLFTEYFEIKGAKILRAGYMTTLIYSGVALVTGYMFLYDKEGMITSLLIKIFPNLKPGWFNGFGAVLFTMTFACTSNHMLFLRNAIRSIDYNTVEAARNMGARQGKVLFKVVLPTLLPTLFSLTVMTFITGLCALSAPQLIGYDSINPEIVRLAGSSPADEFQPQARAALLSIILASFVILLLSILTAYEKKGHYLSVSKTKTKIVKQKISNPVVNVVAHIVAYALFVIYAMPVIMILLYSFQSHTAIATKQFNFREFTFINYFGSQAYPYTKSNGKVIMREGAITGMFSNPDVLSGIWTSLRLAFFAALLSCVIVVVACRLISKSNKKIGTIIEYALLFPWLLPTILICYSFRTFFNKPIWYTGGLNLYNGGKGAPMVFLVVLAYTIVKLPFSIRMIKASFYSIDGELEDAARNLGMNSFKAFLRVELPIIMPSVLAVFALNFNALFVEYDMSATFASEETRTYSMILQKMLFGAGDYGYNINAQGRRLASTVFVMIVSFIILYLVYGVGSRDLQEKLRIRENRKARFQKVMHLFKKAK